MIKPTKWHVCPAKTDQIRVFAGHMKKAWVLSYPLSTQRKLWSDWTDAQADLSLRWAHSHFVSFVMRRLKSYLSRLMTKSIKWHVRPAKTQISLGIRQGWSEFLLSAWRKLASLTTHWAHREDSEQTGRMPKLIWVFAGHTVILLLLSWGGSNSRIVTMIFRGFRFFWILKVKCEKMCLPVILHFWAFPVLLATALSGMLGTNSSSYLMLIAYGPTSSGVYWTVQVPSPLSWRLGRIYVPSGRWNVK